jgi:hypothetical protein
MRGLSLLTQAYSIDPDFRGLCRKLLDDPDVAVRIEAAIPLAESAIMADPAEPRLAPILIAALEDVEIRKHWVELNSYTYRQQPPGSSRRALATLSGPPGGYRVPDQSEAVRGRIRRALIRLEPHLTPEQKAQFKKAVDSNSKN